MMILGLLALVLVCGASGGCGESFFDETAYYSPNWTPEGLIYAQKVVTHYKNEFQGLWFGGTKKIQTGQDTYYVTMDTNGNNETDVPYSYYPYFSPGGTYVCYVDTTSTFHIIRRSDNTEVYSFQPTTESIAELDWGPDEDKLVYRPTGADYLFTIDINGTDKVEISGIDAVEIAWRVAERIVFFNRVDSVYYLAFVSSDGSSLETTVINGSTVGSYPSYYSDGGYVFTVDNEYFYKISSNPVEVSTSVLHGLENALYPKDWTAAKLSPTDLRVTGGMVSGSGIWIVNVDGSGFKEIK